MYIYQKDFLQFFIQPLYIFTYIFNHRYQSRVSDEVEWMRFCDDIESIFTTHNLEKDPLKEPVPYKPDAEALSNPLTADETEIAMSGLAKITDKVCQVFRLLPFTFILIQVLLIFVKTQYLYYIYT